MLLVARTTVRLTKTLELLRKSYFKTSLLSWPIITFNYIELSFQLFSSSSDETFKLVARHFNDVHRYFDKISCLNYNHSEKIIDIFRFCIRRNPFLSKYLDKTTEDFDESQSNLMEKHKLVQALILHHNHH